MHLGRYRPQLFDLDVDPEELNDLANNAASAATLKLMVLKVDFAYSRTLMVVPSTPPSPIYGGSAHPINVLSRSHSTVVMHADVRHSNDSY